MIATAPLALALALASPAKIAVMPIAAGEGVEEKTAAALTEAAVAELRRRPDVQLVTPKEISALLSLEQQKVALGCQNEACIAEIGGALGVDRMVTGDMARLGQSWLVHLKVLDVAKARVVTQADRRIKGGTIDDVLDALPSLAEELFPGGKSAAAPTTVIPAKPPPASATPAPLPPRWSEEPLDLSSDKRASLLLFTDGKGQYVAINPEDVLGGPLLAGDGKRFHLQRVVTGGRNGDSFDQHFWEPRGRLADTWFARQDDGKVTLSCADKPVSFTAVPPPEAKQLLARAQIFKFRWRRYAHALARDDEGRYFFVEGARGPEGSPAKERDYRLYVGTKGGLVAKPVSDAISDEGGDLFITPGAKLRFFRENGKLAAEWTEGRDKVRLVALDVEANANLIYRGLGIYRGERLGTPCDGVFGTP
jgi:TolB-like protein